jgi:hypothetical protein
VQLADPVHRAGWIGAGRNVLESGQLAGLVAIQMLRREMDRQPPSALEMQNAGRPSAIIRAPGSKAPCSGSASGGASSA